MSIINTKQINVPNDPVVQKKIKDALFEASCSYTRIAGEKDFLKELFEDLSKDVDLPKNYLAKVSKIFHKQNFNELTADQESIQELYCKIFPEASID
jgi:hypothetical protein